MLLYKCQNPRFTRTVGADVLAHQKLVLPKGFVRHVTHVTGLEKVTLTVPSGEEWEMRLQNSDGEVSLAAGWQDFANFHSLKCGFMLEFTHEGDSKFSVIIYDTTLCEILYPMPTTKEESKDSDESSMPIGDYSDQSSNSQIETSEGSEVTQSEPNRSDSSFSLPGKKERRTHGLDSAAERGIHRAQTTRSAKRSLSRDEHRRALDRVADFQSVNPFWKSVIYHTYIRTLCPPLDFFDKHLNQRSKVVLQIGDRRWPVHLRRNMKNRVFFSRGWTKFVLQNTLQVGDVCVFELIDKDAAQLKVFISPHHVCSFHRTT